MSDKTSKNIQCLDPHNNLILDRVNKKSNLPDNCALVGVNLEQTSFDFEDATKTTNTSRYKVAIFCIACKRGFKPIYSLDQSGDEIEMAGQCQMIENCLTSSWYNNCSQCKSNYAFSITKGETYDINFQECVQSKVENCFIYDEINEECFKCKKGYFFNTFKQCEIFKANVCKNYS